MKLQTNFLFPLSYATLSGCIPSAENVESAQTPPELTGSCDAGGLDYAVGETITKKFEARLKGAAKASVVRIAPHDGVITMDFNPARLNIFTDNAGKIIRISCG